MRSAKYYYIRDAVRWSDIDSLSVDTDSAASFVCAETESYLGLEDRSVAGEVKRGLREEFRRVRIPIPVRDTDLVREQGSLGAFLLVSTSLARR